MCLILDFLRYIASDLQNIIFNAIKRLSKLQQKLIISF